jgi:MFS family permease
MVIMVTLNTAAGVSGQVIGRVTHYKRLPMLSLLLAIATLIVMGLNAGTLTPWSVGVLLALLGIGFGPLPPVAMVSLQNTVAAHHLGTAVGTLSFLRNLCATMMVAIFGAIVLAGPGRALPRGIDGLAIPAEGFARIFFAAAASLAVALIALVLMEEKPLRSNRQPASGG